MNEYCFRMSEGKCDLKLEDRIKSKASDRSVVANQSWHCPHLVLCVRKGDLNCSIGRKE